MSRRAEASQLGPWISLGQANSTQGGSAVCQGMEEAMCLRRRNTLPRRHFQSCSMFDLQSKKQYCLLFSPSPSTFYSHRGYLKQSAATDVMLLKETELLSPSMALRRPPHESDGRSSYQFQTGYIPQYMVDGFRQQKHNPFRPCVNQDSKFLAGGRTPKSPLLHPTSVFTFKCTTLWKCYGVISLVAGPAGTEAGLDGRAIYYSGSNNRVYSS
jgi:hypothetical protein